MTIKVSKTDWNALKTDQQEQISKIIRDNFPKETIEPADNGIAVADVGGFCTMACNMAQAVAVAACGSLSSPAKDVCIMVAQTAGDACRDHC